MKDLLQSAVSALRRTQALASASNAAYCASESRIPPTPPVIP